MNTRKHSKTLEKSRSWSQVNSVLIALGFSLTCAQAQTTAPNSSLNQTQTQAVLDVAVAGIVANKSVVDIKGIQAIYEDAKTTFTLRDKALGVINDDIERLTADPNGQPQLLIKQAEQKVIENELLALTGTISTLNKFVNEATGTPLGEAQQLTLVKGGGTFNATDVKNTTSLAEVTKLVTAYKDGISSQPSLETTIDSLKNSSVGARSGYQVSETDKVTAAKTQYEKTKTLADLKAYAESVQAQLASYAALDEVNRTQLVTTTLNGSWERTAIIALDANDKAEVKRATGIEGGLRTDLGIEADRATGIEGGLRTDLGIEAGRAKGIEGGLRTDVTTLQGQVQTLDSNVLLLDEQLNGVNGEIARAKGAEKTLDEQLNGVVGAAGVRTGGEVDRAKTAEAKEATAREAEDIALGGRIDGEARLRGNADKALGVRITDEIADEASTRGAEDIALGGRIEAEASTRGAEDTALGVRITGETTDRVAAINAEKAARIAAINAEADRAIAAERAITSKLDTHTLQLANHETRLVGAESKLANHETRLISAESNIQRLNRGIAMTAALVTPTIESGNNNAVSFTAAGYEGDTGFSLGYARRISGGLSAHLAVASSDQFEETVVRGGVNFSW